MTLLEVRTKFVQQTGRYDLVLSANTYTDNGADYYIKAGQRMLDRMMEFPKDEGEMTISLSTGAISTTLTNVLSVRNVAIVDTVDDTIKYLTRRSLIQMRTDYGETVSALSNVTKSEPKYWGLGWLRTNVSRTAATEDGRKKLFFMPPADRAYSMRLSGLFGSPVLSNDTSVSYWSIENPEILISAAMYRLEVSYRNFEGSRAILEDVKAMVIQLDDQVVEQGQVEQDQLKDSHRFIDRPIRNQDRYL